MTGGLFVIDDPSDWKEEEREEGEGGGDEEEEDDDEEEEEEDEGEEEEELISASWESLYEMIVCGSLRVDVAC